MEGLGDVDHVGNEGLDTISLSLNLESNMMRVNTPTIDHYLGLNLGHLVAVEGILDITANVDGSHFRTE